MLWIEFANLIITHCNTYLASILGKSGKANQASAKPVPSKDPCNSYARPTISRRACAV
jgi:hypothetical protein